MKTIYLDILLLTNFAISLAFLSIAKKITHAYTTKLSILIGAIVGSLSSLVILVQNEFISFLIKFILMLLEVIITFREKSVRKALKISLVLILINISYYGLCVAFWNVFDGRIFYIKNMTIYFDIDTKALIILTIFFYVLISIFDFFKTKFFNKNTSYIVSFSLNDNNYSFIGVCDTANNLVDLYYNKPVVVASSHKLFREMSLDNIDENFAISNNKLHIIPCNTINSEGLIYATKPLEIKVKDNSQVFSCEVCIGFVDAKNDTEKCIFNPKILF